MPVPTIIVIAEGAAKAGTVLGAVRAGLANNLIIDDVLAVEILTILDDDLDQPLR